MGKDNKRLRYSTEIKILQSSIKKLNPQFSLCDILVCYHGDNRNRTSLKKEVIEENLYSIYGIPIIGEWIYKDDGSGDKTWGSHGGRIIIDDEGIRYEQTTKPFGFVTKEAAENASWVTITEKDGHTQHEYLKLSGCILWTSRYEEAESILDDNYGQSMELEIEQGRYRDDCYYDIDKFVFSALCILGTEVEPCFESACIGRHYGLDTFKQEFSKMLDDYAIYQKNNQTKGGNEMSFAKFAEILSAVTFKNSNDEDTCKYRLVNLSDDQVFAIDMEDYKPYGFNYAVTNENDEENIVVDFESKKEMSWSATEKVDEEGYKSFDLEEVADIKVDAQAKIIEAEFNKKVDEMQTAYSDLSESFTVATKKLEEYETKEKEAQAVQHKQDIDAVFEKYADKLGKCADFLVYKAKLDPSSATVEEVTEKLTLMAGKYMLSGQVKSNFSYTPVEAGVTKKTDHNTESKYGHLLDKYMN